MAIDPGDLISRLKLDLSDYQRKLTQAQKEYQAAFGQMDKSAKKFSKSMSKSMEDHSKRSTKAAKQVEKSWWETFGRVAIGFTIAYRAMNAFERGIQELTETIKESIVESGELASIQAKLAFWFQVHSNQVVDYSDAFEKAAVNVDALTKASLTSVSSLSELSTGLDEVSQSIGAISPQMIPKLADVVDYTVMVAQTTGSTVRQIRQELQSLMEGQMRTTNILIRSMKNLNVLTDEDIKNLKAMTNRAQIFDKVLTAISEHWTEVKEKLISTDVTIAFKYWEKSIRLGLVYATQYASGIENVGNIFAEEFAKRAEVAAESLKTIDRRMEQNMVLMMKLRDALSLGLDAYDKMIDVVGKLAVAIDNLSGPLKAIFKAFGAYIAVSAANKAINALGRAFLWLATAPIKTATTALNMLYTRILAIPIAVFAIIPLIDTMRDQFPGFEEGFAKIMVIIGKIVERVTDGVIKVGDFVQGIGAIIDALEDTKAGEFAKGFYENTKKRLEQLRAFLEPYMKDFMDLLDPDLPSRWMMTPSEWNAAKRRFEGLTSTFEDAAEVSEDMQETWKELVFESKVLAKVVGAVKKGIISPEDVGSYKDLVSTLEKLEEGPLKGMIRDLTIANTSIEDLLKTWAKWSDEIKTPLEKLKEVLEKIEDLGEAGLFSPEQVRRAKSIAWGEYTEEAEPVKLSLRVAFEDFMTDIQSSGKNFETLVEDSAATFLNALTGGMFMWSEVMISLVGMFEDFVTFPQRLFDALSSLLDAIADWPITFLESLDKFIFKLIDLVPNFISALIQAIGDYLPDLIDRVIEEIPRVINAVIELLPKIVKASAEAIPSIGKSIISAPFDIIGDIFGGGGDGGPTLTQRQQAAWNAFASGLRGMYGHVSDIRSELDEVNEQFDEWIQSLKDVRITEEYLTEVEAERVKVLQDLVDAEVQAIETGIIDTLLGAVAPEQLEQLNIVREFASVVEAIKDLEEASGQSFNEMLTLAEQTYAHEMMNALKQTEVFQNLEESLNKWEDLLKDIRDQILDLETSLANPADIFERMAVMEEEIASIAGANWQEGFDANALTAEEVAELQGLLGDYLELGQEAWQRPSTEYQDLYNVILDSLGILEMQVADQMSEYELAQEQLAEEWMSRVALEGIEDILSDEASTFENMMSYLESIAEDIRAGISVDVTIDLPTEEPEEVEVPIFKPAVPAPELPPPSFLPFEPWWLLPPGAEPGWAMREFERKFGRQPGWALEEFYQGSDKDIGIGYAEHGALASGPESGYPMMLHGVELVTPWEKVQEMFSLNGGTYNLSFVVNESRSARETAKEIRTEIEAFMRSSKGGKLVQKRARSKA